MQMQRMAWTPIIAKLNFDLIERNYQDVWTKAQLVSNLNISSPSILNKILILFDRVWCQGKLTKRKIKNWIMENGFRVASCIIESLSNENCMVAKHACKFQKYQKF